MKKFFGIKNAVKVIVAAGVSTCMAMLVIRPAEFIGSAKNGLIAWSTTVAPSLLPFFFLSTLAAKLGLTSLVAKIFDKPARALFRCGGAASYAFAMSALSGYPVGAKIIADLRDKRLIDRDEATRMSTFCSTSGPLFTVGSIGIGMFASARAGYAILLSHLAAAIICGVIFRFYGKGEQGRRSLSANGERLDNALYECAYSSVVSVALVGAYICVFFIVADVASAFGLFRPLAAIAAPLFGEETANAFPPGLIECTRGCMALAKCGLSPYSVALCSAIVSFGGLSALAQSLMFLSGAGVRTSVFISSKILQTILSFALCLFICRAIL